MAVAIYSNGGSDDTVQSAKTRKEGGRDRLHFVFGIVTCRSTDTGPRYTGARLGIARKYVVVTSVASVGKREE